MTMTFETIKALMDILIIPLLGIVWNIQGRTSKIEGKLDVLLAENDRRRNPR